MTTVSGIDFSVRLFSKSIVCSLMPYTLLKSISMLNASTTLINF